MTLLLTLIPVFLRFFPFCDGIFGRSVALFQPYGFQRIGSVFYGHHRHGKGQGTTFIAAASWIEPEPSIYLLLLVHMGMAKNNHLSVSQAARNLCPFVGHDEFYAFDLKTLNPRKASGPAAVIVSPHRKKGLVYLQLVIKHLRIKISCMYDHIAGL